MKLLKALIIIMIALFSTVFSQSQTATTIKTHSDSSLYKVRTGDTLNGIKYFIKIAPADTTMDERMPMFKPPSSTSTDEIPSDFVMVDKQPVPVKQVPPLIPPIDRPLKGTVWVKCLIGKNGKVKKAEVMRSDAEVLNDAAIQAAKQWEFTPALVKGKPVEVWASLPIHFKAGRTK